VNDTHAKETLMKRQAVNSTMPDAFGRALRDFHRGTQTEPLLQRDGEATLEHPIESFYFESFDPTTDDGARWLDARVDGTLLDVGAGAGRIALHFQDQYETVAIEVSDALVETMADRGVVDARRGDMFALPEQFAEDRFETVISIGTQTCLTGSMSGLEAHLHDLASVTAADGTALLDGYDPTHDGVATLLGHREDPAPGLAHRVMSFEYDREHDPILSFRLFSPERVREAVADTVWTVTDVANSGDSPYYRIALEKR
jgi:hypothetical protein